MAEKEVKKKQGGVRVVLGVKDGNVKMIFDCKGASVNDVSLAASNLEIVKNQLLILIAKSSKIKFHN